MKIKIKSKSHSLNYYINGCANKVRYCTEEFAKGIAKKDSIKYQKDISGYFCTQCGGYHLTTKPKNKPSLVFTVKWKDRPIK